MVVEINFTLLHDRIFQNRCRPYAAGLTGISPLVAKTGQNRSSAVDQRFVMARVAGG
jgi:hypothetical protein